MRRALAVAAAGVAALVALAACTSGGSSSSAGVLHSGKAEPAPAAGAPAKGGSAGSGTAQTAKQPDLPGPALIKTADLHVDLGRDGDVTAQANAAEDIAKRAGGSVYSDDRTSGGQATADLTLKVPPDSLVSTVNEIATLGHEISRSSSTQDVTTEVADINSRVQSAKDTIAGLRVLYQHATRLSDIIEIETQIAQRESDLESLEAQQRALDAQTSMATLTVEFTTTGEPAAPPPKHHRGGFLGGLQNGWDAFASAAVAFATGLGAALPFLVLLSLLGAGATWAFRRRRRPAPDAT